MTASKEQLPEKPAQSQVGPESGVQDEQTWLHVILGVPYIGGFLTFVIAVLPMIVIFAVSEMLFGVETTSGNGAEIQTAEFWTVLAGIPLLYAWLGFLERKLNLAISLPIPFLSIHLKWLLIPFGAFWIYLFMTGETL